MDADAGEFGGRHHAVGARSFRGDFHKLLLAGEELVFLRVHAAFLDERNHFARGDVTGVGHVVRAEGNAFFPACEGGGDELVQLRDRVFGIEELRVAHQFREVVARAVHVVERDAEAPDVHIGFAGEHLFAERLGAAVERAVIGAEAEVGRVVFRESAAVGARAGVDAARGNVTPGNAGFGASLGDQAGKNGVAKQALGFVQLAGVDIGFAGVAGGIDQKFGAIRFKRRGEYSGIGVIDFSPPQIAKWNVFAREQGLISLPDVPGTTKKIDHVKGGRKTALGGQTSVK